MKRAAFLGYAAIAYAGFLAVIGWAIVWLTGLSPVTGIDRGPSAPPAVAVIVDVGLLTLFALHHSVFARPGVKRAIARVIPPRAERSTYILVADILLALVLSLWLPIPAVVWDVQAEPWRSVLWIGYGIGWLIAIAATFMIDHFDFAGFRQAAGRPRPAVFQARWLYASVRHPLMLGLLLAFWITPAMSWGHVVFAGATTVYIAIGIRFEERDLRESLGEPYRRYAERTPALIPLPRLARRRPAP